MMFERGCQPVPMSECSISPPSEPMKNPAKQNNSAITAERSRGKSYVLATRIIIKIVKHVNGISSDQFNSEKHNTTNACANAKR